jgi:hypothetical protein
MTDNAMAVSRCNLVLLAGHVRPDFRMTMRKDGKRMTFDHTPLLARSNAARHARGCVQ